MELKKEFVIIPLFTQPVMSVSLNLDLEKLTEFVLQNKNEDSEGILHSNKGGWHSKELLREEHEEFNKLKEGIIDKLNLYHSEVFHKMKFKEEIKPVIVNMWACVNEKYDYNELHCHPYSTLSGVYYVKHDGSPESGVISFQHPEQNIACPDMHWPLGEIVKNNELSSGEVDFLPKAGRLFIFPSWSKHKVQSNLKDNTRIAFSFNSIIEKQNG